MALALALPATAAASPTLLTGQTLSPGQSLTSADGHYALDMQTDGNLVLYWINGRAGQIALWSSRTHGNDGAYAVLQSDGNLAVFNRTAQVLWSSDTSSAGCTNLTVQDDGNLVLYSSTRAIWASKTLQDTLEPGEELTAGEAVFAPQEQYELTMQTDGNLVLYGPSGALWSSRSNGHPGAYAIMQGDGNLVVYTSSGHELWASNTGGNAGAFATVQNDGNFVVYAKSGKPALWASHTNANRAKGTPRYSRPAFTACPAPPPAPTPPAPAPVVTVPTPTPVPTLPRVHVRMTLSWTWNRGVTHLHRITIAHLPVHAAVTFLCHGRGCPKHAHSAGHRRLRRLVGFLDHRAFRSGDQLLIVVSQAGHRPETVAIKIRYGALPRVRLL